MKYTNTTQPNQTAYLTTNYTINHTHFLTQLYIKQTIIRIPAPIPFHHTPPTLNLPNKPFRGTGGLSHSAAAGAHHAETRTGDNK